MKHKEQLDWLTDNVFYTLKILGLVAILILGVIIGIGISIKFNLLN